MNRFSSLPDNWLDVAASHGATKWVKQFILESLPQLQEQSISPQRVALLFADELDSRGLSTPAKQKNYRSNLVQALKVLDPNHPAIALVSLSSEEYRQLNDAQRGKLADRETRFLTSDQTEALVQRATALLGSAEWSEVAAGLAVLVGRRISEILLSEFSLKSPWSLWFSEMSKKDEAIGVTIEIPTLAPAQVVLAAIERLQKGLRIEDLKLNSLSPKLAKQTVNQRFSEFVAARCVQHFRELVPARSDRDHLYTHIFRAVYATIAAHWFCPPTVPEYLFKAEIQGHFTLTSEGRKLPNYSARANYDDYAIGSPDGNRDGRLGIKLGLLPGLVVLEGFRRGTGQAEMASSRNIDKNNQDKDKITEEQVKQGKPSISPDQVSHATQALAQLPPHAQAPTSKPKTKRIELQAHDVDRLSQLMASQGVMGSPMVLFQALLDRFEALSTQQQQHQTQTVQEVATTFAWFTQEVEALRLRVNHLQTERDRLLQAQSEVEQLQQHGDRLLAENAQLQARVLELRGLEEQLHQVRSHWQHTQAQLEGIQHLLGGRDNSPEQSAIHSVIDRHPEASTPVQGVPSPGNQPQSDSPARRRNRGETITALHQIIDAIIAWNTTHEPEEQLRISIPTIKGLAGAMGASYQPAIQEVLKERASELEEHHSRLLIGTRHNASVRNKNQVLRAIGRDYLGLDNGKQVKYAG
ncbi:MAG: hypothetical protein HC769_00880 [Cyanobacteria bacterium CRU_2_1]|nr:hypothetical protein [Cyanobacteria bacterium CRU_2_1]